MALDHATTDFLKQLADAGGKPLHEMTVAEARTLSASLGELCGKGPDMARVEETTIAAGNGASFPARVLVPMGTPRGVLLYFHGGGWVLGTLDEYDTLARELAARTGCTVVLPGYRLAPEHRYPTAARDAYAALRWVADRMPGRPIVVAGDSAGGNLSAVVTQRARDENGPAIALQVLVYPVTDCDLDRDSYLDPENQLMLTRDGLAWFWDHYAPDRAQRANPDASPLRAADLSGLPPALVLTAEHDVLRDEGEEYAERLREAGVPVELRRFEGQMHVFFTLVNVLPGSAAALTLVAERVAERLG
ncbi:alpha/beta hydrolase [Nonomuraea gerenzanensis]|uniref:Esterase/lipase n=1 Tax=Nonomuraea gerenzanensis TaxID=93944 RepID=A0A1M4E550_9ACTN|nr:alpha/beta hydrolase [Nonomuraea gerenzanensis]UBU16152.1 alpha/beta hydrolase [Nonomuraea gerenzanensis]SBO93961.1 Esterase/lipase [Nonomuraea gerenzanensis]